MTATTTQRTSTAIADGMLQEFEQELNTTRRFLERVPEDKLDWQPHPKSMTAGQLALHVAEVPGGVLELAMDEEITPPDLSVREQPSSVREVLDALERNAQLVRTTLPTIDDARMQRELHIVNEDKTLMSLSRVAFLRSIMLNHWYHHRGQFGVYLRLLGAEVPATYGPSGDESAF